MRFIGLTSCSVLILAFMAQAQAQTISNPEQFNGRDGGNPGCPPPVINGITPKNWSCRTGTQGVQGNPGCAPPVEIINGQPVTPINWSCPGGRQPVQSGPFIPPAAGHPGPAYVPGAANPCLPFGPGGYNWLANPVGTQLPPGCVRRIIYARSDPNYEILSRGFQGAAPIPPGGANSVNGSQTDGVGYRKPPMPVGTEAPGYESQTQCYRIPPMPLGQIGSGYDTGVQCYRRPTLPLGQLAPGH